MTATVRYVDSWWTVEFRQGARVRGRYHICGEWETDRDWLVARARDIATRLGFVLERVRVGPALGG